MKTAPAIAALALAAATSAPLGAQEGSGSVEIITGARQGTVRAGASADGIRVISFVRFDPTVTEYRVIEPLLPVEVLSVQGALVGHGFDPGPLDGQMGPAVRAALGAFQTSRRMDACRCVSHATVQALGLRSLVIQTVVGSPPVDETPVEVIMAPTLPRPESGPAPAPPPPDTVYVDTGYGWLPGHGGVFFPVFPRGPHPVQRPSPAPGGVPFGGSGPLRLGPPPASLRPTRPPPLP